MARSTYLTGVERFFREDEIIVSKTDPKGLITYANDVFLRISGYSENEIIMQPHSIIRHPDMPRCVFKLLWDTIQDGREIFAYVINRSKNGDHYWVLAHVTPTFGDGGNITGYHSSRRVVRKQELAAIEPLYSKLKAEEDRHSDRKAGLNASMNMVGDILKDAGVDYDEFVFSVINAD